MSFRFPDQTLVGDINTNELADKTEVEMVCDDDLYEYFYTSSDRYRHYCDTLFSEIFNDSNRPSKKVFMLAMRGYATMMNQDLLNKKNIVSFIDYSLSANKKRFWVLDIKQGKVLYHELVAHGRNTGEEYARKFSNKVNSYQSSLGFFVTGEIYSGKHELSIKMNGAERLYNGKAFDRGIVIHGAQYVNETYIRENQRLGRSLGCPAVSDEVIAPLSETIRDGSCLFAYYPNKTYLKTSKFLNKDVVFAKPIN